MAASFSYQSSPAASRMLRSLSFFLSFFKLNLTVTWPQYLPVHPLRGPLPSAWYAIKNLSQGDTPAPSCPTFAAITCLLTPSVLNSFADTFFQVLVTECRIAISWSSVTSMSQRPLESFTDTILSASEYLIYERGFTKLPLDSALT